MYKLLSYPSLAIFVILFFGCSPKRSNISKMDSFINTLIDKMTIEEKAGQLTLYTTGGIVTGSKTQDDYIEEIKAGRAGNIFSAHTVEFSKNLQKIAVEETRLGIPLLFGLDVIHGYKTIYPIPLAESCSWDMKLIEKTAKLSALEATAAGVNWTYNPMVDISRDPRWGRVAEGSGEDTYLGSLIAKSKVKGYQGNDLSSPETMLACVKHFAAYGASQAGRDYHTVDMSDRVLRESYLPPYKAALDAGVTTVMTAFNELDGVPASGSKYLFTQILRNEWGFKGFVVSDYTSINEMVNHGVAVNEKAAALLAFNAGVEMDMQGGLYSKYIPELVKEGKVSENTLDENVSRILEMKYRLGLFEDPYRYLDEKRERSTLFSEEFFSHALESAKESIVLLKNENHILPLSKNIKSIALIGPLGDSQVDMLGTWHMAGDAQKVITLRSALEKLAPNTKVNFSVGTNFYGNDKSKFAHAIAAAKKSDVIIMAIGESQGQSGEAASRSEIAIPGNQLELVQELSKLGKPIIVVLMAGRPLTINWLDKNISAILNTWHLGTMAGEAIAETLFGDNNPSGKLTMTFPQSIGQIPIHYNMKHTGRPYDANNKFTSKYIDAPNEPLYPFGYGLSYTAFEYDNMAINNTEVGFNEQISISVEITNTGKYDGEEVVQLYIQDKVGSVTRPVRELKGFKKVFIKKGEMKNITFNLTSENLKFYDIDMNFVAESGKFEVFVGGNSDATLSKKFELVSKK